MLATLTAALAVTLIGTGLTVADAAPGTADGRKAHAKSPRATPFALKSWGYGTRVRGGDVPVGSDDPSYEIVACTNLAGVQRTNKVADVVLPGLGTVSGIKTHAWTTRADGVVSAWAENTIGKVVLSDSPLGTVLLTALSTTAQAYHGSSGFKTAAHTDLARLQFKPPVGPAVDFPLPAPNRPVVIPGVAKVIVAHRSAKSTGKAAQVFANGIKVRMLATDTTVRVAHAAAQIARGATSGLFAGDAYAVGGKAAGDIVRLGRNPLVKMPCQGTDGVVQSRRLAAADLGGQVKVSAAYSSSVGDQTKHRAWGRELSRVASIDLGGSLKVTGIVGQVNVTRSGTNNNQLVRNTRGTRIGQLTVNGEVQKLPAQGIEVPGVAKLEPQVVTKLPGGIEVTALRITLLDGSGAVIDLGNARLQIRHLHRPHH